MSLTLHLLLLLLLILSHQAEPGSIIKSLPGFEGPLPFELETGYIGIGKEEELQTFYYFVKSEKNPKEDPLLIWITGGPGCSSISALLYENGPVTIKIEPYNGSIPSLVSATYSWTKFVNIIFVDQPVGVGFSYKRTPNIDETSDTKEVVRIHEFIQKWLDEHLEFSSNPFYVAGDSYSGKIIPAIVSKISKENYLCCKPPINLQGYIIGNPITDLEFEHNQRVPFSHGMALISDEHYESLKRICKGSYDNVDPRNTKCLKLVKEFHKCIDNIYDSNILLTNCDEKSALLLGPSCWVYRTTLMEYWANDERVREALRIRKGTVGEWHRCNFIDPYDGDIKSSVPYHKYNSIKGYPSLIYSGDHDMKVPFASTQAWIKSLNYSIIDDWRPWMINDQVAGYTRKYANNMTYATIKARRWTHCGVYTTGRISYVPKMDKWPKTVRTIDASHRASQWCDLTLHSISKKKCFAKNK